MAGADRSVAEAGLHVGEEVSRGLRAEVSGLAAEAQGAGQWSLEPAKAEASATARAATAPDASPEPSAAPGVAGLFACGCPACAEIPAAESEPQQSPLAAPGDPVIRSVAPTNTDIDQLLMGKAWAGETIYYGFPSSFGEAAKSAFNADQKEVCRVIFDELNHLLDVSFEEWTGAGLPDGPLLSFGNDDDLEFGGIADYPNASADSDIWISTQYPDLQHLDPGKHQWVYLHEIGHALGLKHPFDTVGPFDGDDDFGHFETDMSYTAYGVDHPGGASTYYAQTYMPLDIRALQHLYGKNPSPDGNDTYVVTASNDQAVSIVSEDGAASLYDLSRAGNGGLYVASWDSGGADKLSFSGFHRPAGQTAGVRVHFESDRLSAFLGKLDPDFNVLDDPDIEPLPDPPAIRLMLDQQSWFETIEGSAHNDLLDGAAATRALLLAGEAGADTLTGGAAADTLIGGAAVDSLRGGGGNDRLDGGAGGDVLDGGAGRDVADYFASASGIRLDLSVSTAQNIGAGLETINGVEDVIGTAHDDTIRGSAAANELRGRTGDDLLIGGKGADTLHGEDADDTLEGGEGNDTLAGGAGVDTLSFAGAGGAVTANLTSGSVSGAAGTDTVSGFERVLGGAGGDSLSGDDAANTLLGGGGGDLLSGLGGADRLEGGEGDDTVQGGAGGDTLTGGGGIDTLSYAGVTAAVTVDLTQGGTAGQDGPDTVSGFENVVGGGGADRLTGDTGANRLDGGGGDDTVFGGGGADVLVGGAGVDTVSYAGATAAVTVNLKLQVASGAHGADQVTGFERVLGGAGADMLIGDGAANLLTGGNGDDSLAGGGGDDQLSGGAGADTAVYADAGADLVVDLFTGTASGQGADTLNGIENVVAGRGDDRLTGDRFANRLEGGRGADQLLGGAGVDVLVGGRDADLLTGGAGADRFAYLARTESKGAARDWILDLAAADVIDLSAIDADAALAGDQAFALASAFDGRSGLLVLTYSARKSLTVIEADVDGDARADMTIVASGDHTGFAGFVL